MRKFFASLFFHAAALLLRLMNVFSPGYKSVEITEEMLFGKIAEPRYKPKVVGTAMRVEKKAVLKFKLDNKCKSFRQAKAEVIADIKRRNTERIITAAAESIIEHQVHTEGDDYVVETRAALYVPEDALNRAPDFTRLNIANHRKEQEPIIQDTNV